MTRTTRVLDHDRPLRDLVPVAQAGDAGAASIARVIDVPVGTWVAQEQADDARGGIGLVCLEGFVLRRVGVRTSFGAELLGPGDILRPWQYDGDDAAGLLGEDTSWRVIAASRFAVLDVRWAMRMAPWPAVGCELVGRALERSRRLATLMAISQHRRLDARLRLLLWKLADRFGVVRRDGVHLEIPLTHEALSLLAVARRPSVSTTLRRLADAGELRQEHRHIVLLGRPPGPDELDPDQPVDTKTFFSSV
jgi:CRP/FNR family cyclic AMP-dependent transcriptional regulator